MHETLVGEGNIPDTTTMNKLEEYLENPVNDKVSTKVNNLKRAIDELFPNHFKFTKSRATFDVKEFTPKFIRKLHENIMGEIVETSGCYRTRHSAPNQENWIYLAPHLIDENITKLCKYVSEEIQEQQDC